jgi:ABC-type multidrug transport system fused ATPase/permease subunit
MGFLRTTAGKIIAGVLGAVVLIGVIALIIWISLNGYWPFARDIALVLLAIVSFIPLLALSYAIFEVARTVRALKNELVPVVGEIKETTQSIRETAKAAGDLTLKPAIRTASVLVGFSETIGVILGEGNAHKRREERRRRNAEEAARRAENDESAPEAGPQEEADHVRR